MTGPDLESDGHLDATIRAATAGRAATLGTHPDPDRLVDYCLDMLSPQERDEVQEHLVLCAFCAQLVLDLDALAAPNAAEAADYRPAHQAGTAYRPSAAARTTAWALAASLLLSIGLLAWTFQLRRDLQYAVQPRADVALVDLTPVNRGAERSAERQAPVRVPTGVSRVVLLLNLGDLRSYPRYRVELEAPSGEIAWRSGDARRSDDGSLVLDLPAAILSPAGRFKVHLDGESPRGPIARLADYVLVVESSAPPTDRR
jgi:hypothetical protein